MKLILTLFWIALGFIVLGMFSLNVDQKINLDLFFVKYDEISLVIVTFSSLLIGFSLGLIFFLIWFFKSKKEKFHLKKVIKNLQNEINTLKTTDPLGRIDEATVVDSGVEVEKEEKESEGNNKKNDGNTIL